MTEIAQLSIYRELYPDAEVINCSELFRKPRRRTANPVMIETGEARLELCRKDGDKMDDEPEYRIVIYDKDYALAKLAIDLKLIIEGSTQIRFMRTMLAVFTLVQSSGNEQV
jgi:hypothetical protein